MWGSRLIFQINNSIEAVRVETTIAWEGPSCEGVNIILRICAWEKLICEGDTISTIGGCNFINGGRVEKLNSIGGSWA